MYLICFDRKNNCFDLKKAQAKYCNRNIKNDQQSEIDFFWKDDETQFVLLLAN